MKLWNHYHMPTTLDEAAALLRRYEGRARIIAGGTDLLVDMKAGAHEPHEALVDVTRIPELQVLDTEGEVFLIGAGVTHTRIVASTALAAAATCLVESCGVIGGPQVRNVGTLGGNVAHALPAGDGTTSLVALDAEADILQHEPFDARAKIGVALVQASRAHRPRNLLRVRLGRLHQNRHAGSP
ncbi:MAG: FAD binding domain-containing protein, partial [Anaerolineae bacterium]|nr:FAD binding domain-containing protein [Anaerolineae bacterium]